MHHLRKTQGWASLLGVAVAVAAAPAAPAAILVVAPGGSNTGSCTPPETPCGSVAYAFGRAAPGDAVELAAGAYGGQTVPATGRPGPAVEVRPSPGAAVSLAGLSVRGGPVVVRDLATGQLSIDAGDGGTPVRDVTVLNGRGPTVFVQTAIGLTLRGGSYGGNQDRPTMQIAGNPPSRGVLIDGVDFHDAVATNDTVHMECIWAGGVQGFTVRNSIFRNCAYFDIFFTVLNGPDPRDVLLENNVFEVPKQSNGQDAPYAINIANWLSKVENFTVRNNSFGGDFAIQPTTIVNSKVVGNVGILAACKAGVTYAYNVWTSAKCASTDVRSADVMSGFVNPAVHDWHLEPGARAINAGSPVDFPPTDRDGKARVGRADAGAHEFGTPGGLPTSGLGGLPPGLIAADARRPRILSARLARKRICRRAKRGCPASVRLRLRLDIGATVNLRVQRAVRRHRWRTVRTRRRNLTPGRSSMRIRAKGLRRGRYRVVVRARSGSGPWTAARRLILSVR